MTRKAANRFRQFVDTLPESSHRFPLLHTTSLYTFMEMCSSDFIEPSRCPHYGQDLTYLFYGRPAYRTKKAEFTHLNFNWPIIFILDPDKVENIQSIYPFDTGAFFLKLYDRYFDTRSRVEDFKLPGSLEYAAKLVSSFYSNEKEYLLGRSKKNIEVPLGNFEAQGVAELAREPSLILRENPEVTTRDERSSSIEIQTQSRIEIKKSATGIILPADFLTLEDVISSLSNWDFQQDSIFTYEVNSYHGAESLLGKVYDIVQRVYDATGVFHER